MFRKNYLIFALMITAALFGSTAVSAQTSSISGRVQLVDDKDSKTPVPNVLIEAYRTDTKKVEVVTAKTDDKGEFTVNNLPSGKPFALAVSGANIDPAVTTDVSSGAKDLIISVKSGSGAQPTFDQVYLSLSASDKLSLSPEEKAAEEKALKEKEAENAKLKNIEAITKRAIEEGNKAFNDKDYDLAITKYEEGYQADTDYLGSAPTFLNNKGVSLQKRALDYHNKSVSAGEDKEAKAANYKKSLQDFTNGIDAFYESWTLLKNASDAEKKSTQNYQDLKMRALSGAFILLDTAVKAEKVNADKMDKAKELLEEYVNAESDKTKKAEAQTTLAGYYRYAGDFEAAVAEYRKILAVSPKEPGALFGLGLSLIVTGYNEDGSIKKSVLQEGVNLLKRFKDVAPSDIFKREIADAESTLNDQKVANNITPQK